MNAERATPKRRRSSAGLLLALALVICLGAALAGLVLANLPQYAAETFGPPAPALNLPQRIRLSAQLLLQAGDLMEPRDPLGAERPFEIALGEGLPAIAARLQAAGLIADAGAFRLYLLYAGLDTTLQAGEYTLSPAMTPLEIAHRLQDATPGHVLLTVLPGWRLEEVAATLPTSGLEISPASFLKTARSRPSGFSFLEDLPAGATLEGFLFPGSYRVAREASADEVIALLLTGFEAGLTPEMQQGFQRQGLNAFEAASLASIVERESMDEDEMPLIASVFLNRLSAGMNLEADSTVQYAHGFDENQQTWWKNPLSSEDLLIDSPYNTYLYPGLPPGPIANPGLSALRAVAFPAQTPYFYFRAACDGSGRHLFAETFEEHVGNACP